jgi:hypothetical protein
MPATSNCFFAHFTPDALALIADGTALEQHLQRMVPIDCGIVWAAARAIERGEASATELARLSSSDAENTCRQFIRPYHESCDPSEIELQQSYNAPGILPYRCPPGENPLDWKSPVSAADLIRAVISRYNFENLVVEILRRNKIDPRVAAESLRDSSGFRSGDSLRARGTIPPASQELYRRSNALAAFVGSWLITRAIAMSAANRAGQNADALTACDNWEYVVAEAKAHVEREGCKFLVSFPGPRPWSARAAKMLGTTCGDRVTINA